MPLKQLQFTFDRLGYEPTEELIEQPTLPAPPDTEPWYLKKLDQTNWTLQQVELEEDTLVVLRVARNSGGPSQLHYIPRYGRSVEDVYVEPNGHIRERKSDRLLA